MKNILPKKSNRTPIIAFLAFILFGGFLFFGGAKDAGAADSCKCLKYTPPEEVTQIGDIPQTDNEQACITLCKSRSTANGYKFGSKNDVTFPTGQADVTRETKRAALYADPNATEADAEIDKTCNTLGGFAGDFFKCLNLAILKFCGWLLSLGVTLFAWAVDARKLINVINDSNIYEAWKLIRDLLNITFILVLLYTAFTIIFQVDSSNKKIILTVVLMALLVNFSFPISRFVIDVANTLQYTLLNSLFGAEYNSDPTKIFAEITNSADLARIISGKGVGTADLISSIIFVFILAVTFIVMGLLFLVRIVALALLIIFSPIAFVGVVVPMGGVSSKWWDNLFKYAFFGPIMVFMIYISIKIMHSFTLTDLRSTGASFDAISHNVATQGDMVTGMAKFSIPIVILWVGMGVAQSMGIVGAAAITGGAKKFMDKAAQLLPLSIAFNSGKWFATKAVPYMASSGIKKFERDVLGKNLSPRAWIEGWKQRSVEVDKDFLGVASGNTRDKLHALFDGTKTHYEELAESKITERFEKEYKENGMTDVDRLAPEVCRLVGSKEKHADKRLEAAMRIIGASRDPDEILGYMGQHIDEVKFGNGKSLTDLVIENSDGSGTHKFTHEDTRVNNWNMNQLFKVLMKETGADDDTTMKAMRDIGNVTIGSGGIFYGGVGLDKNGKMAYTKNADQMAYYTMGKLATVAEEQKLAQITHRNHATDEYYRQDGTKDTHLNPEWKRRMSTISISALEHAGRTQPNFTTQVGGDAQVREEAMDYASEMLNGTAKVWNNKTEKYDTVKDANQAYTAALHMAVVMSKAGVPPKEIRKLLESKGFRDTDIIKEKMKQAKLDPDTIGFPK